MQAPFMGPSLVRRALGKQEKRKKKNKMFPVCWGPRNKKKSWTIKDKLIQHRSAWACAPASNPANLFLNRYRVQASSVYSNETPH